MDRRTRKTRHAIRAAFTRLFFEYGYDGVSMEAVAAAADIGRSTLYAHFRRKEDVLCASMTNVLDGLASAIAPAEEGRVERVMEHFWQGRRHRRVFNPGRCRSVLAEALAARIEGLTPPEGPGWRVPKPFAARLIADHQLNLVDHWLMGHNHEHDAIGAAMRESVLALFGALYRRSG